MVEKIGQHITSWMHRIRFGDAGAISLYQIVELYFLGIIKGTLTTRASSIAFSFFMAMFPFLIFVLNLIPFFPIANIEDTTTDVWRRVMGIHLDATFWGCQSAIALMKKSGGGSIVNMSSTAALIGLSPYLAYSAAKGGIRAMTKSIAIHCRSEGLGIRCNSVHPGSISTPMVHEALKSLMETDLMAEEDPEKTRVALGIGEPEDVANMVLYLLSDESKHVTGAEMVIDNGDTVI